MGSIPQEINISGLKNENYPTYKEREAQELVFILVEPIGGGAKDVEDLLRKLLLDKYKYNDINIIHLSNIIEEECSGKFPEPEYGIFTSMNQELISDEAKRIYKLQMWGNILRKQKGNDFLARKSIKKIAQCRIKNAGIREDKEGEQTRTVTQPIRVAHIIRSIKNEDELNLLKDVYGNIAFVIAKSDTLENQKNNYAEASDEKGIGRRDREYSILSDLDQSDGTENGQQVRKVFCRADLFLTEFYKEELSNFLSLLFVDTIHSPTIDERMMFEAFAASMRSTCLSRQVGAALSDEYGNLISIGWNDVPTYGGGLATDFNNPTTLCKFKGKCNSNSSINNLMEKIYELLNSNNLLKSKIQKRKVTDCLKQAGLSGLIEFSRATHAEMEAILSAARLGKHGIINGKLYVTTYPCENCIKHILASGIQEVIFIEPYPKSRATEFFKESIKDLSSLDDKNIEKDQKIDKLKFRRFSGIAPQSYPLLYRMEKERKEKNGEICKNGKIKKPNIHKYIDSYILYESQIAKLTYENNDEVKYE